MTNSDNDPSADEQSGDMRHRIPEWYIPDGPVRLGGEVESDDLDSDGRPPRLKTATENGHDMHSVAPLPGSDPGHRDVEGTLSCLSCSCDGRDLELIECPARHYNDTRVHIPAEQLTELRKHAERTGQPATPR